MNRYLLAAATAAGLLVAGAAAALAQGGTYGQGGPQYGQGGPQYGQGGPQGQGRPYGSYDGLNRWMTVNNFSYNGTAVNIYIIPTGANCCWSHDLLGASVIQPGRSLNVNFDNGSRTCVFDIRITSEDPRRDWNFNRVDVCNNSALNLR
jgi:hypothetical protein